MARVTCGFTKAPMILPSADCHALATMFAFV
jgi:hypothetical protein